MKAPLIELQEEYDNYVDVNNIKPNRDRHNVMARYAFMVAAREVYNTLEIARVTGKDHSTVVYASSTHESNLRFDNNYMSRFNESCVIVEKLRGSELGSEKWELMKHNAVLQQRLTDLREEAVKLRQDVRSKNNQINEMVTKYELSN